jgi:hypothetical protein
MRGFVLAAAMILVSAGAQADASRNPSLGGSDKASYRPRIKALSRPTQQGQ